MTWLRLANKTAIVTGAASGIGAAVAKALAAEQCQVVLADKNVEAIERLSSELSQTNKTNLAAVHINCDVTDPSQVQSLIQHADEFAVSSLEHSDKADAAATMLVNCAGITRDNWISKLSLDDWNAVLDVNLKATFLTCQAFLEKDRVEAKLVGNSNISIVNIGSFVSEVGNMGQINYAASKGGVLGLTRSLAKEIAPLGFRANAVLPGFIDSKYLLLFF